MLARDRLKLVATLLQEINAEMSVEMGDLKSKGLNAVLTGWYLSREEYEALDEMRKGIGQIFETLSRGVIPEMMRAADTKTTTIDSIRRRFTISKRFSCSILDKEAGYKWLRDEGNGAIITETVNSSTLSAFAKKRIEDEGLEMPETIFKTSIMDITSATKV